MVSVSLTQVSPKQTSPMLTTQRLVLSIQALFTQVKVLPT